MKELLAAFVKAQAQIEKATKDKANPHFRSKYADLGNVIDAIKPALEKHGLGFIQKFHDDEKAIKVETVIFHESGEEYSCGILSIPVTKHDAQGFGSACTYARRYSLQAAFGVAPEDDDGNAAAKADPKKQTITPTDGALDNLDAKQAALAKKVSEAIREAFAAGDEYRAYEEYGSVEDVETRIGIWELLKSESKIRSTLKRMAEEERATQAEVTA